MVDYCATDFSDITLAVHYPDTRRDRKSFFLFSATVLAVPVHAGAHLRQSGLLVADFRFADGRQLLQGVAVVGERPRQSCELCPSYRAETIRDRSQDITSYPDFSSI